MSEKPYKIFSYPTNPNVAKFLIVAHEGGIADQIDFPQDFKFGVDNKSEWFLKTVNPTGQVPALKTPDGYLFESNAMAFYLAKKVGKGLVGQNDFEFGQIVQWVEFYSNWIKESLGTWIYPYNGWATFDAAKEKEAKESLKGAGGKDPLGVLNRHLNTRKFLVGEHFTLADIIVFVGLWRLFTQVGTPDYLADLPHLVRWAKDIAAIPSVKKGNYDRDLVFTTKAPELPKK